MSEIAVPVDTQIAGGRHLNINGGQCKYGAAGIPGFEILVYIL